MRIFKIRSSGYHMLNFIAIDLRVTTVQDIQDYASLIFGTQCSSSHRVGLLYKGQLCVSRNLLMFILI